MVRLFSGDLVLRIEFELLLGVSFKVDQVSRRKVHIAEVARRCVLRLLSIGGLLNCYGGALRL